MEITVGNIGVLVGVAGAILGAARYYGTKLLTAQAKLIRRYDLFIKIGVDYYKRTGNNMAYELVKEYEELYGPVYYNPTHEHVEKGGHDK